MKSGKIITTETWKDYSEALCDGDFMEYLDATEHIVKKLEKILVQSKNFKELKNQLTDFKNERKTFLKHAFHNYP